MPNAHSQGRFFGYALVIIGLLFLLKSFDIWHFHWSQILIIVGIFFYAGAFTGSDRGPIFPGTIILLIGLFFLLREYDVLDDPMYYMWPVFLVITGTAFIMLYIFRPSDWGLLIPGTILLVLGILFLAYEYDVFCWNPGRFVRDFWPLILIVVGAKMLIDSRSRYRKQPEQEIESIEGSETEEE